MSKQSDEDILRFRAKARAALQHRDPRRPAFIEIQFVGCIGDGHSRSLPNYDFTSAEIYKTSPVPTVNAFARQQNETLEAFRDRVLGELPAITEFPPTAIFFSDNIQVPSAIQ